MNLALTGDQRMIRDSAQEFLAEASSAEAVRAAMKSEGGFDAAVWQRIGGELGWCGTIVPESHGGLGLGPVEMVLILEQMGRQLLCAPFFSTVCLAANALVNVGTREAQKKYLPRIAAGTLRATAVVQATRVKARRVKGGWALNGRLPQVVDGATAELVLTVAQAGKDLGLFAVERAARGMSTRPATTWDATRRFADLEFRNAAAERVDDAANRARFARADALAQLYLAAEQLGGAQQCLDLTVRYVSERKQFGRAIASFQAVKHRCAQMMVQVEGLRSAVYGTAAFAAGKRPADELALECGAVRALASDTFFHCAAEAIQLHGGVGFTSEFAPQLYFKRAQAGSHWLGTADALRERIAVALLGRGQTPISGVSVGA